MSLKTSFIGLLALAYCTLQPVLCFAAEKDTAGQAIAAGKTVFEDNCSSCHGAHGTEGGAGPSLKNLKARRSGAAIAAWIKNPAPPMPKMYPSAIGDTDIKHLVIYLQSL